MDDITYIKSEKEMLIMESGKW